VTLRKVRAKARLKDAIVSVSYLPEEPALHVTLAAVRVVYHVRYSVLLLIRHRAMAVANGPAVARCRPAVERDVTQRCRAAVGCPVDDDRRRRGIPFRDFTFSPPESTLPTGGDSRVLRLGDSATPTPVFSSISVSRARKKISRARGVQRAEEKKSETVVSAPHYRTAGHPRNTRCSPYFCSNRLALTVAEDVQRLAGLNDARSANRRACRRGHVARRELARGARGATRATSRSLTSLSATGTFHSGVHVRSIVLSLSLVAMPREIERCLCRLVSPNGNPISSRDSVASPIAHIADWPIQRKTF